MINMRMFVLLLLICYVSFSRAMIYDNRFFPWYNRVLSPTKEKESYFIPDLFFVLGSSAFLDEDEDIGIPEIFGKYDEGREADAVVLLGNPNPLPAVFQNMELPWRMSGHIDGQGIALTYYQYLCSYVYTGFSIFFMHVTSRQGFKPDPDLAAKVSASDLAELDQVRRQMNTTLGIQAPKWSASGMSDIDWYVRVGNIWEYPWKFKQVNAGLRFGALFPTGVTRDVNNPASVPFGGNGLWGVYVAGDAEFELKEDLKVGFLLRFNNRFKKTAVQRVPIAKEQLLYAALVAPLKIDPGLSVIFSPYIRLEGIRDGLGVQAKYTVVVHDEDTFSDKRKIKIPSVTLVEVTDTSGWRAEYFTVNAFYDFSKMKGDCSYWPTVSFMWDMPVRFFTAERVSKTHRISLGVEFNF